MTINKIDATSNDLDATSNDIDATYNTIKSLLIMTINKIDATSNDSRIIESIENVTHELAESLMYSSKLDYKDNNHPHKSRVLDLYDSIKNTKYEGRIKALVDIFNDLLESYSGYLAIELMCDLMCDETFDPKLRNTPYMAIDKCISIAKEFPEEQQQVQILSHILPSLKVLITVLALDTLIKKETINDVIRQINKITDIFNNARLKQDIKPEIINLIDTNNKSINFLLELLNTNPTVQEFRQKNKERNKIRSLYGFDKLY